MSDIESNPGVGGVELTQEARRDFDKSLEEGRVRIIDDGQAEYIEVQTIPIQRDGSGPFFGRLHLGSGFVSSDVPGQRATPEFLAWAREKMGYQPTGPKSTTAPNQPK